MSGYLQPMTKAEERPHLISPSSKKTNVHWSSKLTTKISSKWTDNDELFRVESIHKDEEEEDSEGSYNPTATSLKQEKSRKRRSNGSLISPKKDSPLPPLPTVENFLAIMDASSSPPNSPYFSAQSLSLSSQSTLNSVLLDDITEGLASAHIMEPCLSSESSSSSNSSTDTVHQTSDHDDEFLKSPPPVPPKDPVLRPELLLSIDPIKKEPNKKKRASAVEIRVSTHDVHRFFSPKSADVKSSNTKQRSSMVPPRRSSMPLPPPKIEHEDMPPLPLNAKQITDEYNGNKKPVSDERYTS